MKLIHSIILSVIAAFFTIEAAAYDKAAFHCESDTTVINTLLASGELKDLDHGERVAFFVKKLVGSKSSLREEILEADSTQFTVNIHSFTPLGLISTCVALAQAYETSSSPNWRDFADRYEAVMYKAGKAGDFASKLLYGSDWIADNIFRGNVEDVTPHLDGMQSRRKEKSIDYISHHPAAFKALGEKSNLDRMKMLEMGFRNHQIPYISNGDLTNTSRFKPQAKDGDFFFLISPDIDLDFREMGILVWDGEQLRIIHVSWPRETVTLEELPFEHYVKRNIKRIKGARIIRII